MVFFRFLIAKVLVACAADETRSEDLVFVFFVVVFLVMGTFVMLFMLGIGLDELFAAVMMAVFLQVSVLRIKGMLFPFSPFVMTSVAHVLAGFRVLTITLRAFVPLFLAVDSTVGTCLC